MSRNWRERPAGRRFSRWWRPWYSLRPSRGAGTRINEPKSVGLRDLVAAPSDVTARPEVRWRVVGLLFAVLLAVVVVRLFFLQVVEHAAAVTVVEQNSLRVSTIAATRGEIVDRNGTVLVGNVQSVQLQISRQQAHLDPPVVGALSSLTGLSVADIYSLVKNEQYEPYQPVPILTNTPPNIIQFVSLHPEEFPGVSLVKVSTRVYPHGGALSPHVLGYVGPITGTEIAEHPGQGYVTNSTYGQNGVEMFYENFLRGHDGTETLRVNASGSVIGTSNVVQPKVGDTVVLNTDAGLQTALDQALAAGIQRVRTHVDPRSGKSPPAPSGAALVMNVHTGAIVAMSSYPSYNLNAFTGGLSNRQFAALEANGAFNNYAIQGQYTPGSTFKLITATAQLQTGILPANRYLNDSGTFVVPGCLKGTNHGCVFHDDETSGTGLINLPLAITRSSDYYFYNLGYLFWSDTSRYGETPIQNVGNEYGLGQYTQVDLPYENVGRIDSPAVRQQLHAQAPKAFPNSSWYTGDNVEMAFGQGATAITPIELAQAYATFANGGTRYAPEVAAAVLSASGKVIENYQPHVLGHVSLPPSVRNPILQGLVGVVNDQSGTAYQPFHQYANFNLNSYVIAGKTGTASNQAHQEPNSWFVGFGPASSPQYVVLCVIGQGGYGANGAAPVVAQTFNYLVAHPLKNINLAAVHATTQALPATSTRGAL